KGTVDQSATWQTFDVVAAADGEATLQQSGSYGDYVIVKTVVEDTIYYTLYAHLDVDHRILTLNKTVPVSRGQLIGKAGKSGSASNNLLHLHFELSKFHYGRPSTQQEITECSGVNGCGTCRLDPYGIYGTR